MKKFWLFIAVCAAVLVVCLFASSYTADYSSSTNALGKPVSITAEGIGAKTAVMLAFSRIAEVESRIDPTRPGSDLAKINNGAVSWGSPDMIRLINRGLYYSALTDGRFNIASNPLSALLAKSTVPTAKELEATRRLCDYSLITQDSPLPDGFVLDLSALSDGFIAGETADILRKNAVTGSTIQVGGTYMAIGQEPRRIDLPYPYAQSGKYMGAVLASNKAVSMYGPYQTHSLPFDAASELWIDNGIIAAVVMHDVAMDADALVHILLLMGRDGLPFIEKCGGQAFVITRRQEIFRTSNMNIEDLDEGFVIISNEQ